MSGVAVGRLAEERKAWRKDHQFGFSARPRTKEDGSTDLLTWDVVIPGKAGTNFAGGEFPITLSFSVDYPSKPPKATFPKGFFHVNVYPSGNVCLSILNDDWRPSITIRQVCVGVQELLANPNPLSPAHSEAYVAFTSDRAAYDKRIRDQTKIYPPKT